MERKEFENIAHRIRPRLISLARVILASEPDAEDVTQDTLLKLWTMRDSLHLYRSVEALAMTITRNFSLDRLRHNSVIGMSPLSDALTTAGDGLLPDEQLMLDEAGRCVDRIMARLPENQRAVMRMRHVEGLDIDEIARIAGTSEGNVRTLLSRARKNVKQQFVKENED